MTRRVLFILVILTAFVTVVYSHRRKHRHCPSRDDDDHVCCDWKTMSYLETRQTCELCTQPTSANPLCGWNVRGRVYNYCLYRYTVNVTVVTCNPRCCDGWTIDEHGECSIRSDQPKPDIVCENGGSPAKDYCICPAGFSGKNCETAVCNPPCLNSGMCGGRNGAAVCICPAKFTGKQCETPICEPACQNGGTCTGYYDMECRCPPGFAGKACEYEIKDGDCPKYPGTGACYNDCQIDHDCPGTKKCCPNACGGNVCTYPAKTTCTYNGSNYTVGQVLQMTPCKTCFCKNPDSDIINQWECLEMGCPNLPCPFTKTMPGMCCPVCDVPPSSTPAPGCTYNGTKYPYKSSLKKSDCEQCTCDYVNVRVLDWACMISDCFAPCENPTKVPGQCCPVCPDIPRVNTSTYAPTQAPTTKQPSCFYNGMEYAHMSVINKAPCETCRCVYMYGGRMDWECALIPCNTTMCSNPRVPPGQCCPVCEVTTPRPDSGPVFSQCPTERIVVLQTDHESFVDIRKEVNLQVTDSNGKVYAVKYTKEIIYAQPCNCSDNIHFIQAQSEPDIYGRFAVCHFTVHVYDNHSPIYSTCPSNIAAYEDEIIMWQKPVAIDNVALDGPDRLTSKFQNNSKFEEGSHVVLYVAKDHQNNFGVCMFVVAIYKRGTTDPTAPLELTNPADTDKSLLINVIIGVFAALIMLCLAIIFGVCYRRMKKRNLRQPEVSQGYDNGIYATPNTPPPSYSKSFAGKLPPKYIVNDEKPPLYEEINVKGFIKKGMDNPIYDSSDELEIGEIRLKIQMEKEAEA